MARPNAVVVPITSEMEDSVIIDCPKIEKAAETGKVPAKEKTQEPENGVTGNEEEEKTEDDYNGDMDREPRYPYRREIIYDSRDYSPPRRPRGIQSGTFQIPVLVDTSSLNAFIKVNDVCADTANNQMVYIANHPFHAADVENISWLFKMGVSDTWVKKPVSQKERERERSEERGRGGGYYDHRYDRYDEFDGPGPIVRRSTIAKLGNALRVFKSDDKKYGTEKVKFVIAVKGRGNGRMKLRVAYSRQAAMVDIFHELLNGCEILFVGAVLQEVVFPVDRKDKAAKFQRVASLKEAQELKGNVVGVIC